MSGCAPLPRELEANAALGVEVTNHLLLLALRHLLDERRQVEIEPAQWVVEGQHVMVVQLDVQRLLEHRALLALPHELLFPDGVERLVLGVRGVRVLVQVQPGVGVRFAIGVRRHEPVARDERHRDLHHRIHPLVALRRAAEGGLQLEDRLARLRRSLRQRKWRSACPVNGSRKLRRRHKGKSWL